MLDQVLRLAIVGTIALGAATVPVAAQGLASAKASGSVEIVMQAKQARLPAPAGTTAERRDRLPRVYRYERNEYSRLIEKYGRENGVSPELGHAIIEIESRFRPNVRGRAGEIGLMQIKPATARMVGFRGSAKALYDPETNIKYGMRYLGKARKLGSQNGVCGTILKYNAGHGARRMNPISRRYCEKVKAVFERNRSRVLRETGRAYAALDKHGPAPKSRMN